MNTEKYNKEVQNTRDKVKVNELVNFEYYTSDPVKVSIIVPVCNVENYLAECIESAINQTLKEIEIICVNDGSSDKSLEILKKYASYDKRVKIIDKENAGYGHAMNIGIDMARGEYIGIIEGDDFVEPTMFETLYLRAKENMVDICRADFDRFEEKHGKRIYTHIRVGNSRYYDKVVCPAENRDIFKLNMQTWAGIYKNIFLRDNIIRHNETPGASYQDNGFFLKSYIYAKSVLLISDSLYRYRFDNPNSSINNQSKVYCVKDEYDLIEKYLIENNISSSLYDVFVWKKYRSFIFTLNRIAFKYKKDFLAVFGQEMKRHKDEGHFDRAMFSPNDWKTINWIVEDSSDFFYENINNKVKVSVILAVYNTDKYLRECLDSLINQTLKEIEIICVDDGSTDDSLSILQEYSRLDKRIKILVEENGGAGKARNYGLQEACGEYLSFLDSDDVFEKTMLQESYQKAKEQSADVCIFRCRQFDSITKNKINCSYSVKPEYFPSQRPFAGIDVQDNIFMSVIGWAWDKLFNRKFVIQNDLRFMEQRTTNDMFFVFMALVKAGRISFLDRTLVSQRQNNPDSLSASREKSWNCFINALLAMKKELEEMKMYERFEQNFVNYALHSTIWNLRTLMPKEKNELYVYMISYGFKELGILGREDEFWEDATNKIFYKKYIDTNYLNVDNVDRMLLEDEIEVLRHDVEQLSRENSKLRNLQSGIEERYSQYEYDSFCLNEVRKSWSYRIGLFITALPRKLRRSKSINNNI